MPKFRKKPVEVEAMQFDGTPERARELMDWTRGSATPIGYVQPITGMEDGSALADTHPKLAVRTLEGVMSIEPNDWVIRGVKREHYPCKPDIFAATYEPVT